jgi:transposase
MVYSSYTQHRILFWARKGMKSTSIVKELLCKYKETGSVVRRIGSGRPPMMTDEMMMVIDEAMEKDDETSATQLQQLLLQRGHRFSLSTILRHRRELGWTFRGSSYCQLIREPNKVKRYEWAKKYENITSVEDVFGDVVWTDETTVQIETHRRHCCRKKGKQPRP